MAGTANGGKGKTVRWEGGEAKAGKGGNKARKVREERGGKAKRRKRWILRVAQDDKSGRMRTSGGGVRVVPAARSGDAE